MKKDLQQIMLDLMDIITRLRKLKDVDTNGGRIYAIAITSLEQAYAMLYTFISN